MYKNAERVLNDRDNVSKTQIRNAVTKSRIDSRVKRVSSMIHLIQPPSHDEVILPKNDKKSVGDADDDGDEASKLRSEEQKMKLRLLKSAAMVPPELAVNAQPLNRERLNQWMSRVYSAEHAVDTKHYSYQTTKKKKRKEVLTQAAINLLEKKLQLAIRGEYRSRMAAQNKQEDDKRLDTPVSPTKKSLTTRMLLPYYKLDNVNQFMDIFAKVDENFSGDLDVNEWIKLFTSLDESIPTQEARMIFMKIDKDSDGFLTMRELIPVVFNRANKEQQRLIIQYAEAELTKKHHDNVPKISRSELEQLFDAYDSDRVGFVNVSFIKDRIKTFHLSEQALFFFFETVSDLADDEMVNLTEFMRIFKPFATLK